MRYIDRLPLFELYTFLRRKGKGYEDVATIIEDFKEPIRSFQAKRKRVLGCKFLIENDLLDEFIKLHWPNGNTPEGKKFIKEYCNLYIKYEDEFKSTWQKIKSIQL